jgi:hypothetical protein
MAVYFIATIAGFFAALLLLVEAVLPYIVRRIALAAAARGNLGHSRGLRQQLTLHYWLGYAVLALVFAHTSFLMGPAMSRSNTVGLWAATLAFLLLIVQVLLGITLRDGFSRNARTIKTAHFTCMITLCGLIAVHLLLN